jgi:hypothetical protein
MAAQQAPQGEKSAPEYAVHGDGFDRVGGTAWIKTAGMGEQRRYAALIQAYRRYAKLA